MKSKYHLILAVVFVCFLFASVRANPYSRSYEHPKVLAGKIPIRSACIMPVEGKLTRVTMKGGEGMSKASDDWSAKLQIIVESHLKSSGVLLLSASDALNSGASEDELHQVLLDVQTKYQAVSRNIDKKPKDIGKSRFTLGDGVALLPCAAKSDVLVFVEGEGEVLSGGQKAMGYLVTGRVASTAVLRLTMADAKTGEILAFVRLASTEQFINDSEKAYGPGLDQQFKKMRIGVTPGIAPPKAP